MVIPLNDEQSGVVYHQGAPLLIVAGPGSGKTTVIIERIKYLVSRGIRPSEILCLTFSEKAANEMKERLQNEEKEEEFNISTFHSFANELLCDNSLHTGLGIPSTLPESYKLVWGIRNIDDFEFKHINLGSNSVSIIESIFDGISNFKNELISPDELCDYIQGKANENLNEEEAGLICRLIDLSKVYRRYEQFKRQKSVIDFDDMILHAIRLLKSNKHIRISYQKRFRHIFVDEFQDNNYAQLELLKCLVHHDNVTVVGDDDQSIYRFQGAYLTNFQDFKEHFKNSKTMVLNQNYRSPKNIVDLSNQLLQNVPQRQNKQLYSLKENSSKITVVECQNDIAEVDFVIRKINSLIGKSFVDNDGVNRSIDFKDFIILARKRNDGRKFVTAFKTHGLPCTFIGESDVLRTQIVKDFLMYLKIISSPNTSGIELNRLMHLHGIYDQNIITINREAKGKKHISSLDFDFVFDSMKDYNDRACSQYREVKELIDHLEKIIEISKSHSVSEIVFEIIMNHSDLYKQTLGLDSIRNSRNRSILNELIKFSLEYERLEDDGTIKGFIEYLSLLSNFDLEIHENDESNNSIQITTIHQSKGREFPFVFVVDAASNKIPSKFKQEKFVVPNDLSRGLQRSENEKELHLQEERRLFYVAMTRTKSSLFICFAKRYGDNKTESKPSKFLEELKFRENPLIELISFKPEQEELLATKRFDRENLKNDLQQQAIKAINVMNLKTAIQRIIDLSQIDYYEKFSTLKGYDLEKSLDLNNITPLSEELIRGTMIPLFEQSKISLSVSKIGTYDDCPLKFKYAHIHNIPSKPKVAFDIGITIHSVIEQMTKLFIEESVLPNEGLALDLLEKNWIGSRFKNITEEKQAKESSMKMLRSYLNYVAENEYKPVAAEEKFSHEIGQVPFIGSIDMIGINDKGDLSVIDFKTGLKKETKNTISENVQLNVYAMAVEKKYKKIPKIATIFYLKDDKQVKYEIDEKQVNKIKSNLEEKVKRILNEEFDATPSFNACRNCDYVNICDEKMEESS